MATFYKRGKRWHALVRRRGIPTSDKSFPTKSDAAMWARDLECKLDRGFVHNFKKCSVVTMTELFERYKVETARSKKNAQCERYMLDMLTKHFGHLRLNMLNREDVAIFRDFRLGEGKSPATVRNNLHLLSAVLTKAINDWGYELPYNPVHRVSKPSVCNSRNRRLEPEEERRLLEVAKNGRNPAVCALILLALETAMRLGELLSLNWANINYERREALLPETKNGNFRRVPLSSRAIEVLKSIKRADGEPRVFYSWSGSESFHNLWARLIRRAGISDLRFHDLRHEAASRYADIGMDIMRIAAITGHSSLQMLKRYTHFRTEDLARELDRRK